MSKCSKTVLTMCRTAPQLWRLAVKNEYVYDLISHYFFQAREITSGERLISADFSPLEPTFFSERSERRKNDSKIWIPVPCTLGHTSRQFQQLFPQKFFLEAVFLILRVLFLMELFLRLGFLQLPSQAFYFPNQNNVCNKSLMPKHSSKLSRK